MSNSGDNHNSGLIISDPLKEINFAIEKALPGDSIYILPGTYKEIINIHDKNGIPENPICLSGFSNNPLEYPVIDGGLSIPSNTAENDWLHINNSGWIDVSNLTFINGWTYPVKINNSSYISFRDCKFYGGKRVINAKGISTHHVLVEHCFWDQGGEYLWKIQKDSAGIDAWLSMHHLSMGYYNGSLIDFNGTGGSIVIRSNKVINAYQAVRFRGKKGYDSNIEIYDNDVINMRDNDFEPEYYTYNLHIYHNRSHNIHKTLSVDNVEGGLIFYYGNVITSDNDPWSVKICSGIWKLYGIERTLSYPIYAFNNSFFSFGTAFLNMNGKAVNLKHFNNAYYFMNDTAWGLKEWDSSYQFDNDISNKPWPENILNNQQEQNGIICDPEFVDPIGRNLMLKPYSKCIDAGRVMSFKEFDWIQHFIGKAPDIGAFENGKLVEGPPFRFLTLSELKIEYREKPRIVRYYVDSNIVLLYFSGEIDPASVNSETVSLFNKVEKLKVISVTFPVNGYEMQIKLASKVNNPDISIYFNGMPKGKNGEYATYWASTIKIHKSI